MVRAGKASSWQAVRCPVGVRRALWDQLCNEDKDFVARRSIMTPGRVNAWIETKLRRSRSNPPPSEEIGR